MRSELAWLSKAGVGDITLSCTGELGGGSDVVSGRTTDFLTDLEPTDTVYAAGAAAMVSAVKRMADEVGALCYTDPFSSPVIKPSLFQRLRQALDTGDESHIHPGRSRISNEPVAAADPVREVRGARPKPQSSRAPGGFAGWLNRS
jgi:3-phenylpropionate/trans-cinnamate dioxygenase ferredoxin reductase subunit